LSEKKILTFTFILWVLAYLSGNAFSGELEISSENIIRTFQRNTPASLNKQVIPFYEYARIDYYRDENSNGFAIGPTSYGGRISLSMSSLTELSLLCKNLQKGDAGWEQNAEADMYWTPMSFLSLEGRSFFNLITQAWREHHYNARINVDSISINPFYRRFRCKDDLQYPNNHNNFFTSDTEETLKNWGVEVTWPGSRTFEVGLKAGRYDYSLHKGKANLFSGALTYNATPEILVGAELGRMAGQTPEDSFRLYRGFLIWSASGLFGPSWKIRADLLCQSYDAPIHGKDKALLGSLSATRELIENRFRIKASLNYRRDPLRNNDVSGMVTFLMKF
jgi:hypothetical protein